MQSETVNFIRLEKHDEDSNHTLLCKVLYIIYKQAVMQKYHMEEIKILHVVNEPLRHTNMGRFTHLKTRISNVKYLFRFLTIITKNGSFIPSVAAGSALLIPVHWIECLHLEVV